MLTALAVGIVLSSCQSPVDVLRGGPALGPMQQGEGWGTYCGPKHGESDFVLGIEDLTDTGDHHLVLDSAALDGAANLTETAAYVSWMPSGHGGGLMGVVPGAPPHFFERGQAAEWADRRPLSGTHVPPSASPGVMNLLVVVHSANPDAMSSVHHLVVHYHSGRQHYVYTGNVTYQLAPGDHCRTPR